MYSLEWKTPNFREREWEAGILERMVGNGNSHSPWTTKALNPGLQCRWEVKERERGALPERYKGLGKCSRIWIFQQRLPTQVLWDFGISLLASQSRPTQVLISRTMSIKSITNILISKKESSLEGYNYLDQVLFVILNEHATLSRITVHKPNLEPQQPERKYNVPCH